MSLKRSKIKYEITLHISEKLMLVSGEPQSINRKTEILDFNSASVCSEIFETFWRGAGGKSENNEVIMCSKFMGPCYITPLSNLEARKYIGSIENRDDKKLLKSIATTIDIGTVKDAGLWIAPLGAENVHYPDLITKEGITQTSAIDPNIRYSQGCAFKINSTTVMIIGGFKGTGLYAAKYTWFGHYNEDPWRWIRGPSLNTGRYAQGCALLELNRSTYIVVVSGIFYGSVANPSMTDTIEWMELTSTTWTEGNGKIDLSY